MSIGTTKLTPLQRFMAFVEPTTESGCWLWTGGTHPFGYGVFSVKHQYILAHRASYEFFKGEIPKDLQVLHRCDVPCCVNPAHLFLGTHDDNMRDKINKGRNYRQKITDATAAQIRRAAGTQEKIAQQFGCSQSVVSRIKAGHIWKHVN